MDAPGHRRALSPHVTKQIRRPQGSTIQFPLKKHYDKINFSFEGVLAGDTPQEVEFDWPGEADEDGGVSGDFPMDQGEDPHQREEEKEPPFVDCKLDAIGRRYPVDIYMGTA